MTRQTVCIRILLCLFTFCNFVHRKTKFMLKILLKYSVFLYEFVNPQNIIGIIMQGRVKSLSTFQAAVE